MEHPNAQLSEQEMEEQARELFVPEWKEVPALSDEEADHYFRQLRSYFLYGENDSTDFPEDIYPLRFAARLRGDESEDDDPVLEVTGQTALHILNGQNQLKQAARLAFLRRLKRVAAGLQELLLLQDDDASSSSGSFDFADELIAFDQIKHLASAGVSSHFPPSRVTRLRSALQTLTAAQVSYTQRPLTIHTSEALAQAFALDRIFDQAKINVAANPCEQARSQSQQDIQEWVQLIKALRMGELMIAQKYEEQLHDAYFDRFNLTFVSQEELQYLPPTLVIEESRHILQQTNDFLALLTNTGFVKVLGINWLEDLFQLHEQADTQYLELASLAICRRNAYVFQGGMDTPALLEKAYQKGLAFPGPVFWNILLPSQEMAHDRMAAVALQAAAESRYFPRLEYETNDNHFVNQQIDLQHNPDPEIPFTKYKQDIQSAGETTSRTFQFTLADFLAMHPQQKDALAIVPATFQHAKLVPVAEYVSLARNDLAGHIPFIWVVDEQNKLQRVAIPQHWIQECRQRLEYWDFLQSLAGTNAQQRQATVEHLQADWEKAKHMEVEVLKASLEARFARERSSDLQAAVYRILHGLLNEETDLESVLMGMSEQPAPPRVEIAPVSVPPVAAPVEEQQEEVKAVPNEAWVESDVCTSCRDCIDALPAVFKYNENKQAYVHNPKGGTFAKIVLAAEKCPAACIHPGVPQNKEEADLEKWMKRAEKFN